MIPYLIVIVIALLALLYLDIYVATAVMYASMSLLLLWSSQTQPEQQHKKLVCWLGVGMVVGMVSDLLMNMLCRYMVTQRENTGRAVNWFNMVTYFDTVGALPSMLFAGALTALMTLNTFALLGPNVCPYTCVIKVAPVGFVVGAAWGVWVESLRAKAAEPLMVFYDNTKGGYIENRLWDGATIALGSSITWVLCSSI